MLNVGLPLPFTNTPLSPQDELRSHDCYKYPKQYLGAYGIEHQVEPHREIFIFLCSTALLTFWAYQFRSQLMDIGVRPSDAIVAIWALGVLLLGYLQWQEARHEISMDKYYDRLEIANKKREEGGLLIYRMMHPHDKCYRALLKKMMLVYSELDNLEYMIEKYKLGFMKPEQACRGLRTFQHRCRSEEFRQMAKTRVADGDYSVDTAEVVRVVIAQIEAEIQKENRLPQPPFPEQRALLNHNHAQRVHRAGKNSTRRGLTTH